MSTNVYICHTLYHVYISVLKRLKNKRQVGDIMLVSTIPSVRPLSERLANLDLFRNVIVVDKDEIFLSTRSFHLNYLYVKLRHRAINRKLKYIAEYNQVYIFNDYTELGAYLNRINIPYHLLEDGCDCFKKINQFDPRGKARIAKRIMKKIGIPVGIGMGRCILDIEVNENNNMRTPITVPVLEVSRKSLMESVGSSEIKLLYKIFNAQCLKEVPDNSILVLTEPLWELGIVHSKEENGKYYLDLAARFPNSVCYIKPHPRDDTDYGSIFQRAQVIDKNLPIELLNYLGSKRLLAAVTHHSTSIQYLNACRHKYAVDPSTIGGDIESIECTDELLAKE